MQKIITKTIVLLAVLTLALSVNYIFAAWTGPTEAPPGGNTPTPVHIGTTAQVKDGGLSLNALSVFGGGYFQGKVGVGVVTPTQDLEVAGQIKIGKDDSVTSTAGTIRWSGTDFEGYNGTEWKSLTSGDTVTNQCPVGQDSVDLGSTSICLADGAIAQAGCSDTGYSDADGARDLFRVHITGYTRYLNNKIQTKVVMPRGSSSRCDSGWVDGNSAGCLGAVANSSSNGVEVSYSAGGNCQEPGDGGNLCQMECSARGSWQ
jgi:hypothetical protein